MSNQFCDLNWLITNYTQKYNIDISEQVWKWAAVFQNRFSYKNLPDTIPSDIIEYFLYYNQQLCFFRDDVTDDLFVLPVVGQMDLNIYYRMDEFRVVGGNGYNTVRNTSNSVLLFNDKARSIPSLFIMPWIVRICECLDTEEQNITANKVPYLFYGDEQDVNSINREWKQIKGGKPFIIKRKGVSLTEKNIVQNTGVSYIANEIQKTRRAYEAEILSYFGIQNLSVEKMERVNVSEVETLNKMAELNLKACYNQRKAQMNAVNEMFGTNIEVILNDGGDEIEQYVPSYVSGGAGIPIQW